MSGYYGRGEGIGHVGELLQGAVRINGHVSPFLVTLPAPWLRSEVEVRAAREWSVSPIWKRKALRAAQAACVRWRVGEALVVGIASEIPVGRGCGSSTADCVAAVRAVAAWAGVRVDGEEIAAVVHEAEVACDPTMFDGEPVAFLPREGRVLRRFAGRWPAMDVKVVEMGGAAVDTEACAVPAYPAEELDEFEGLLERAAAGFATGDGEVLARVAMRSAEIHQGHRPHPAWRALCEGAMREGAWGVAVAHSGTVAAVLRAPSVVGKEVEHDADFVGGRR